MDGAIESSGIGTAVKAGRSLSRMLEVVVAMISILKMMYVNVRMVSQVVLESWLSW
jgi:hypothetical protein